jgi:hypothetical protein
VIGFRDRERAFSTERCSVRLVSSSFNLLRSIDRFSF